MFHKEVTSFNWIYVRNSQGTFLTVCKLIIERIGKNVKSGKKIDEQTEVDAMAQRIEDAIAALEKAV